MPTDAAKLEVMPSLRICRALRGTNRNSLAARYLPESIGSSWAALGPSTRADAPMSRVE